MQYRIILQGKIFKVKIFKGTPKSTKNFTLENFRLTVNEILLNTSAFKLFSVKLIFGPIATYVEHSMILIKYQLFQSL